MSKTKSAGLVISIRGEPWEVARLSKKEYRAAGGPKGTIAVCDPTTKKLLFREAAPHSTIMHELFHAYCRYLFLESTSLSHQQFEEIIADMLGESFPIMVKQVGLIYKGLSDGKKKR